jgi:hypothetical protein
MKSTVVILLSILTLAASIYGQNEKAELADLTIYLGLRDTETLTIGKDLPKSNPVKVFIDGTTDIEAKNRIVEEIRKWNTKSASKYGQIDVVSQRYEADVTLVRFQGTKAISKTVRVPPTNTMNGRPIPSGSTHTYSTIPVYAYIVVRNGSANMIAWSKRGSANLEQPEIAGAQIADKLFTLLKSRGKISTWGGK